MADISRILVPTDFSPFSDAALAYACRIVEQFDATLHLVHVTSVGGSGVGGAGQGDEHRKILERLNEALGPDDELNLKTAKELLVGSPYHEITKYAREKAIDVIIMGTHGRRGLAHLALGSVVERVLRSSPCPVVVVPSGKATQEAPGAEFARQSSRAGSSEGTAAHAESSALDLIQRARTLRATDVHIDPTDGEHYAIRFRIDGRLQHYCTMDHYVVDPLVNQYKTFADLDIAEPFSPKEGHLRLPTSLKDLEVRVTTAPVAGGEAVALRLFARENVFFQLNELGFSEAALEAVQAMLRLGEGLVLVTGPTGAGKTTTVYSMLERLSGGEKNVVSIEDPIEFAALSIRQMGVDPRHGITMTTGLRTLLRMDPDIIFLGEIRDPEAAEIAMLAAASGKYVVSTLHARDVASTITVLRDMKITDRSVSGNLTGIVNQRLIRRLCTKCRRSVPITDEQQSVFADAGVTAPEQVYERAGCDDCRGTGYHGRIGVFEAVHVTDPIAEAIASGQAEGALRKDFRAAGVIDLQTDALEKAAAGITDFKEARTIHWLL